MIRRNLLTGLLVMLPIVAALWVILTIVQAVDEIFPRALRPKIFGHPLPGLGILTSFALLMIVGAVARNFLGQRFLHLVELGLGKIPVFGKTYGLFKQVVEVIFGRHSDAFRRVVLLKFPHAGAYALGFVAGVDTAVGIRLGRTMLSVYVPTTPNPTSGYFIYVPEEDTIALDMPVEQALKMIVTLGTAKTESGLFRLPGEK